MVSYMSRLLIFTLAYLIGRQSYDLSDKISTNLTPDINGV